MIAPPPASLVSPFLQFFFAEHLIVHRRVSPETVASYRDTFRLLLQFLQRSGGIEPSRLTLADMQAPVILRFLDSIEQNRGNCARTRNARLAAIRSFFRLVALRDPASVDVATRVLAIPVKRWDHHLVGYLTRPEIDAILAAPDTQTWTGRRDHALLLTLYNTGARVSEMVSVQRDQFSYGPTSLLHLTGKGRKERSVPLWPKTARILRGWLTDTSEKRPRLFTNARGGPLSRDGVAYILQQAVKQALPNCPTLAAKHISPHVIRHTTAMHLLQSGVDITVIALWLGHESLETTHIYIEADLQMKQKALEKVEPAGQAFRNFKPSDDLLAFLSSL
jgi:site-specific recombinase XerD